MTSPLAIMGGAGGIAGPSSSASSDGTQASPFNVNFGGNGSPQMLLLGVVAVVVFLSIQKGKR